MKLSKPDQPKNPQAQIGSSEGSRPIPNKAGEAKAHEDGKASAQKEESKRAIGAHGVGGQAIPP